MTMQQNDRKGSSDPQTLHTYQLHTYHSRNTWLLSMAEEWHVTALQDSASHVEHVFLCAGQE
jgi:hypothetical protein